MFFPTNFVPFKGVVDEKGNGWNRPENTIGRESRERKHAWGKHVPLSREKERFVDKRA